MNVDTKIAVAWASAYAAFCAFAWIAPEHLAATAATFYFGIMSALFALTSISEHNKAQKGSESE